MKFSSIIFLISSFCLSVSAFAGSQITNRGDNRWLPSTGVVTANKICHFANESMLRISTPTRVIETSVNYEAKICVKKEYKMNYDGYTLPLCVQYQNETFTDSLYYTAEIYDAADVFRENVTIEKRKIPACE
jgi:hypothetical protein